MPKLQRKASRFDNEGLKEKYKQQKEEQLKLNVDKIQSIQEGHKNAIIKKKSLAVR